MSKEPDRTINLIYKKQSQTFIESDIERILIVDD